MNASQVTTKQAASRQPQGCPNDSEFRETQKRWAVANVLSSFADARGPEQVLSCLAPSLARGSRIGARKHIRFVPRMHRPALMRRSPNRRRHRSTKPAFATDRSQRNSSTACLSRHGMCGDLKVTCSHDVHSEWPLYFIQNVPEWRLRGHIIAHCQFRGTRAIKYRG